MKCLAAFLLALLASPALAQTRQPAQMTTLPTTSPQEFDLLDNTGKWVRMGLGGGVQIFGVDPTGVQDATSVINAALASSSNCWFLPKGIYKITGALNGGVRGCLRGDGSHNTILAVNSATFNLSALGAIVFPAAGDQSFTLRDIGFEFTQPQVAARASLVHFPPAIYAQGAARFVLDHVYIGAPDVCLDARGNSGGAFIDSVECGSLTTGMLWDGAVDTVRINNWHHWPFGAALNGGTTQLGAIFSDTANTCASIGRVDGLNVVNLTCYTTALNVTANANTGGLTQDFVNLAMDSYGANISVAGGRVRIVNGYSTGGNAGSPMIAVSGGGLEVVNHRLVSGGAMTTPVVNVTGGSLHFVGGVLGCNTPSQNCVLAAGGGVTLTDVTYSPGGAWTVPVLQQSSGSLAVRDGTFTSPANGVGMQFATDSVFNQIDNVILNGWTVTLPATATAGQYGFYRGANAMAVNAAIIGSGAPGAIAAGQYALYGNATQGAVLAGKGSSNDVGLANNAGQLVVFVPTGTRVLNFPGLTLSTLPACVGSLSGALASITDATAPTWNAAITGGGAVKVLAMCNGTNWVAH